MQGSTAEAKAPLAQGKQSLSTLGAGEGQAEGGLEGFVEGCVVGRQFSRDPVRSRGAHRIHDLAGAQTVREELVGNLRVLELRDELQHGSGLVNQLFPSEVRAELLVADRCPQKPKVAVDAAFNGGREGSKLNLGLATRCWNNNTLS